MMIDRWADLARELRQRRAVRYFIAYAIGSWVLVQVVGFFVEQGYIGRRLLDVTLFLVALGVVGVGAMVWYHGEEGRQSVRPMEKTLYGLLAMVGVAGAFWLATRSVAPQVDPADVFVQLGESSIAVLPFDNDLADPAMDWLDMGVSELLATDLAQVPSLRVVSSQRISDLLRQLDAESTASVPTELRSTVTQLAGARFMLSGRVAGTPDNMVIVASLEDVRTGEISAAAREQGADVFSVVDRISARLVRDALAPEAPQLAPVSELTTATVDAYARYQQGLEAERDLLTHEARAHYEAAVALDSTFALAHFHLAGVQVTSGDFPAALESLALARTHATNAAERDRLFMEGLGGLIEGDFERGEGRLSELIDKYPDDKEARIVLAGFLRGTGQLAEADRLIEGAIRLDPFYGMGYNALAYSQAGRGNLDSAAVLAERYTELNPGTPNPLDSKGEFLEMAGRYEEARVAYRSALDLVPGFASGLGHLARSYLREDRAAEGRRELAEFLDSPEVAVRARAHRLIAESYIWDGDFDEAMASFTRAEAEARAAADNGQLVFSLTEHLYAAVELGRYEQAHELGQQITALGRNPIVYTVQAVSFGEQGQAGQLGRLADDFDREYRNDPAMAPFFGLVSTMYRAYEAFYRGEFERVLSLATNAPMAMPGEGTEYIGYPVMRSILALGMGDRAVRQLDLARNIGIKGPPSTFPFDAIQERLLTYYEGRAYELLGDRARATAAYQRLIDGWGEALREVPMVADTYERLAALQRPPVA